jgi:hypothetical protein
MKTGTDAHAHESTNNAQTSKSSLSNSIGKTSIFEDFTVPFVSDK